MRCVRANPIVAGPCERCAHNGRSCVTPQPQVPGRKRGAAGRYWGVDKALRNLQSALRNEQRQTQASRSSIVDNLSELVDDETLISPQSIRQGTPRLQSSLITRPSCTSSRTNETSIVGGPSCESRSDGIRHGIVPPTARTRQHNLKSNPLWLIADASREALAATTSPRRPETPGLGHQLEDSEDFSLRQLSKSRHLLDGPTCVHLGLKLDSQILEEGLDTIFTTPQHHGPTLEYFKDRDANRYRDTGLDLDPVEQGIVTIAEAQRLFPMSVHQPQCS